MFNDLEWGKCSARKYVPIRRSHASVGVLQVNKRETVVNVRMGFKRKFTSKPCVHTVQEV